MSIDIIGIVGFTIALISIIIVIWDHFKDDRLLSKQVQEFYEDIENVIFTFYANRRVRPGWYDMRRRYYEAKIDQTFNDYSKYVGLARISGTFRSRKFKGYINSSDIILISEGRLDTKIPGVDQQMLISDKEGIKEEQIKNINRYLNELRDYWKEKYHKFFFKPKLRAKLDFHELMKDTPIYK